MRRTVLLIAVVLFSTGCFVFDELDKGRAIMEQHSPKNKAEREKPPAPVRSATRPAAKKDEGLLASVQGWLSDHKPAATPSGPTRDPDDVPVSCRYGNRTHFLRKSDCLLRGGKIL